VWTWVRRAGERRGRGSGWAVVGGASVARTVRTGAWYEEAAGITFRARGSPHVRVRPLRPPCSATRPHCGCQANTVSTSLLRRAAREPRSERTRIDRSQGEAVEPWTRVSATLLPDRQTTR
jgi:hypothetical protein